MRLLVTGVGGLVGSNLAAVAARRGWTVLGTFRSVPVSVPGASTLPLDVADRRASVALAERFEPDVVVHAASVASAGRFEREPPLAELALLGTASALAAAAAAGARCVLVSRDLVFGGLRPPGELWEETDTAEPASALGRSLLERERLVLRSDGGPLVTRPADLYGVNRSIPLPGPGRRGRAAAALALERHVWERSGTALRLVRRLRSGRPLAAPPSIHRTPTYAADYAERLCGLIALGGEGLYNSAGPVVLGRLAWLRLLARAFGCDLSLVHEGSSEEFLGACGEPPDTPSPPNTALSDRLASLALGRPAVDPIAGLRLMRRELDDLLLEPLELAERSLEPGRAAPDPPGSPPADSRASFLVGTPDPDERESMPLA